MKAKVWIAGWLVLVLAFLGSVGYYVYRVDPFFHYHKPLTSDYYYSLNNERSQNDGIVKHWDYDALITGTSMTENFKTSEMDELFGTNSIKVPFSGGSYKEINDNVAVALKYNDNLKMVVRCLDMGMFFDDKDRMRSDLGDYPTYLYDSNPFNDVNYLFSRSIIWGRVYSMVAANEEEGFTPGITSFDAYARWQYRYKFGTATVLPNGLEEFTPGDEVSLTDAERETIRENIEQNVTSLAEQYPDVDFYYFFSPYSAAWWQTLIVDGTFNKQLEAEQYIIEMILEVDNIHLFSFNNRTDITTDLNNYKDSRHYGMWVNSMMLKWMHDGEYQLTKDNYLDYLEEERAFYSSYDYMSLNDQVDYEKDFFADAVLQEERYGVAPLDVLASAECEIKLKNAELEEDMYERSLGIRCKGSLSRQSDGDYTIEQSLRDGEYVGAQIEIDDVDDYHYLVFYGKKYSDHGQPTVMLFSEDGSKIGEVSANYHDIDSEWHQYLVDISAVEGTLTVVFNGGYIDNTGSVDSEYVFSGITLY